MPTPDAAIPTRLAKRLVELLGCSRSEADRYIADGWVTVDGEIIEEPQFLVAAQEVALLEGARLVKAEPATLVWHKPAGASLESVPANARSLFSATERWEGDLSGVRPLRRHLAHLEPVLSLEPEVAGLVVLSQDRRIQEYLGEAARKLEQEYVVEVRGTMRRGGIEQLAAGLSWEGRELAQTKASYQSEDKLRLALKAVRPGEIAALCEAVGLTMVAAKRLRVGRLSLSKMPVGAWRYLPPGERL